MKRLLVALAALAVGAGLSFGEDCPSGVIYDQGDARTYSDRGIVGYGAQTVGGSRIWNTSRDTVWVTTTDATGAGSLYQVATADTNSGKFIGFSVTGVFTLTSHIEPLNVHNVTILGATAPDSTPTISGPSIVGNPLFELKGSRGCHDWIFSNLRFRNGSDDGFIRFEEGFYNFAITNCSFGKQNADEQLTAIPSPPSGGTDEDYRVYNGTIQYCIFSENPPDPRSVLLEQSRNFTLFRNMFSTVQRIPRWHSDDCGPVEFIDNVAYNWIVHATYVDAGGRGDVIGNTYIPGPATSSGALARAIYYGGDNDPGAVYQLDNDFQGGSSGQAATSTTVVGTGETLSIGSAAAFAEVMAYAGARFRTTGVDTLDRDAIDSLTVVAILGAAE